MRRQTQKGDKMISRRTFFACAAGGMTAFATGPSFAAAVCSGVDPATGDKPPLSPPAVTPVLEPARPVPDDWRRSVLEIIARFEAGSPDVDAAFANVSDTDVVSLGFLQWNHNSGSLYHHLLGGLDENAVAGAPAAIRTDLLALKRLPASGRATRGKDILESWRGKNGLIRSGVRTALQTWLLSPPVRAHQQRMVDDILSSSLRQADAWQKAVQLPTDGREGKRAFFYFVDMEVFSGNLDGLWAEHVRAYRAKFASDLDMLQEIKDWADACGSFHYRGKTYSQKLKAWYKPEYSQVYRRPETRASVSHWIDLLNQKSPLVDQTALNLIALGYLRALRSTGTDKPRGMAGVFRLDVLNRRGIMAVGEGYLPGDKTLTKLFSV